MTATAKFQNCASCAEALEGPLAPHLCARCGKPQPVSSHEDYFSALGVERRFDLDPARLEKRFYEISRALHPDRFAKFGGEAMQLSNQRMSFLNEAYRTLKDKRELRGYVLKLEGVPEAKSQIPSELAEGWFEIQDSLMEHPESVAPRLLNFEKELADSENQTEGKVVALESRWNGNSSREALEGIAEAIQTQSYLKSLRRDVDRLKTRLSS